MPTTDQNGRTLCFEASAPNGPAILFLNSLGTALGMWDAQAKVLADAFHVIRFDWPGHGGSTQPKNIPAAIGTLVDDALKVLDANDAKQAHIVGLSLGGLVAQAIALHAPERVLSLTLCATSAGFGPPDMWSDRAEIVRREGMVPMVIASRPRWFTSDFMERNSAESERLFDMLRAVRPEGYALCCEILRDTDLRPHLPSLRPLNLPVQLIAGAQDAAATPARLEEIRDLLGYGHLSILEDAAHILNVEQAKQVTGLIRDFILGDR